MLDDEAEVSDLLPEELESLELELLEDPESEEVDGEDELDFEPPPELEPRESLT